MTTSLAVAGSAYATEYKQKLTTAAKAVERVRSNSNFSFGMGAGQPPALLAAVADRIKAGDLKGLKVYYKIAMEHAAKTIMSPEVLHAVELYPLFMSGFDREIIKEQVKTGKKVLSYLPCYFYQIPRVLTEFVPIDSFVVTVSPMDKAGYFSLGTNNDYASTVLRACKWSVVEVNKNMPRVFGESLVHVSEIDAIVENDVPLLELPEHAPQPEDEKIGKLVADLIPDGATIQMGIGGIPNAVARFLTDRKDLGIHTELLCDGMIDLIKKGIVNGRRKSIHKYKTVFTVALGSKSLYEFMNDNSSMESYPASYCNDPAVIARNDNMISVNSAIEIDLYGQVNAENIAHHEFSGTGGALDFMRGAYDSRGGKSFLALYSTAKQGQISRIVARLENNVTDPRMDTEFVITEYGITNLKGKSTKERALALIDLAHPKFREELISKAKEVTLI
jgi:itaconate CoA-transferase